MTWEARWSCHLLEGRNIYLINFGAQNMPVRTWSMSRECDLGLLKQEEIAESSEEGGERSNSDRWWRPELGEESGT
jgi:hypothetical protein